MSRRTWAEVAIASVGVVLIGVALSLTSTGVRVAGAEFLQAYDLAILKTAPSSVLAGNDLTYDITVTNNGTATSYITVTDTLPPNTTFQSLTTTDFNCTTPPVGQPGSISCTRSSMASPTDTRVLTFVVNVDAATPKGTLITNTAAVAPNTCSGPCDEDPTNDSSSANTTVDTAADLVLVKTGEPDVVIAGLPIAYTLTVTNNGPSAAQNVQIVDTIPPNTTFISATPSSGSCVTPPPNGTGTVTCTYPGSTAPGESHSVVIIVDTCAGGVQNCVAQVVNNGQAASSTFDPNTNNNTATATTQVASAVPVLSSVGLVIEVLLLLAMGGWALARLRAARRSGAN